MPYSEKLAKRIREIIPSNIEFSERKMFGGLAFLVCGHMAIAASGKGGILVRCCPDEVDNLLQETDVDIAVMRGNKMNGWLRVSDNRLRTKKQLEKWVDTGIAYVSTLPAK